MSARTTARSGRVPIALFQTRPVWRRPASRAILALLAAVGVAAFALPIDPDEQSLSAPEPLWPSLLVPYQSNQEIADALGLIEEGRFALARKKAEDYLRFHPLSAAAEEVLGIALVLDGKVDEGLTHLQLAIQINPKQSTAITKVGDVYLARGEIEKAKAQFQQAVALNPTDRFAHQRLGLIAEQERDSALAVGEFEKGLLGAPPEYLGIKVDLGRLYNRSRQFEKTVDLLRPVVTEKCPDPTAHLILGTAWLGLRATDRALVEFARAGKLETQPGAAQLALGIAYRDAGNLAKSREELENALRARPDWSAAEFQMAETLVASGRVAEAMDYYAQAARDPAAAAGVRNRMAEVYSKGARYDDALRLYESLRKDGLATVRTYDGLATLLQTTDRLTEAGDVLREAAAKFPGSALIQFRLGMYLALMRDYQHAIDVLRQARQLAPADPRVQKAISLVELRRGDPKAAIAEARRLLQIVRRDPEDEFYLATLLDDQGESAEATRLYEEVLRADPDHVGALNNLAQARLRANEPRAALDLAEKAARVAPKNASVLDTLGWAQYRCGDLTRGTATLENAVAVGPANPVHRYHLAVLYSESGRKNNAREQLALALKPGTDFPEREAALRMAGQLGSAPP